MILQLDFILKNPELPIEYRKVIMSFLKENIKKFSQTLYDRYYNNCNKKNFTFSTQIKDIKFSKNKIETSNNSFALLLSTNDIEFGYLVYNVCLNSINSIYPLKNDNFMLLTKVTQKKETIITNNLILCKTLSPICICDHKPHDNKSTRFISIKNEDFSKQIKEKYNIEIKPINCKTTIVSHQNMKFETTSGEFILCGTPNQLTNFYKSGLGSRTGEGFGMFKVIKQGEFTYQ